MSSTNSPDPDDIGDVDEDDFSLIWEVVAQSNETRLFKLGPTFVDSAHDKDFFTHDELNLLKPNDQYVRLKSTNTKNAYFYDSQDNMFSLPEVYISQTCMKLLTSKTYPAREDSIPYRRAADGTMGKIIPRDKEPRRRPPRNDPSGESTAGYFWNLGWTDFNKSGTSASTNKVPPRFVNPNIALVLQPRNQLHQAGIDLAEFTNIVGLVKGLTRQTNVIVQQNDPDHSQFICVCPPSKYSY